MDFSFTDEQEQLRREARTFLADRFPFERVAELLLLVREGEVH